MREGWCGICLTAHWTQQRAVCRKNWSWSFQKRTISWLSEYTSSQSLTPWCRFSCEPWDKSLHCCSACLCLHWASLISSVIQGVKRWSLMHLVMEGAWWLRRQQSPSLQMHQIWVKVLLTSSLNEGPHVRLAVRGAYSPNIPWSHKMSAWGGGWGWWGLHYSQHANYSFVVWQSMHTFKGQTAALGADHSQVQNMAALVDRNVNKLSQAVITKQHL